MPVDKNSSGTDNSGSADDKGGQGNRKIGGKYNSVEDAVEELIKTRDSAYHETREELSAIKQLLETQLTPIGDRGRQENRDDDYRRGRSNDDDELDPAEFLANPNKFIRQREDKLRKDLNERHEKVTAAIVGNAAIVLRFQMKNEDLDEHEDLVESFLRKTDQRKPLAKRLEEAGKATRVYLAKIKGKDSDDDDGDNKSRGGAGRVPEDDEFIEDGAGNRQGGNRRSAKGDDKDEDESPDKVLSDAVAEQKQFRSSRFAAPARSKSS